MKKIIQMKKKNKINEKKRPQTSVKRNLTYNDNNQSEKKQKKKEIVLDQ